jgi:hypothetical protein
MFLNPDCRSTVFSAQPCACQILWFLENPPTFFSRAAEAARLKLHAQVNRVSPPSLDVLFDRHGPQRFLRGVAESGQ